MTLSIPDEEDLFEFTPRWLDIGRTMGWPDDVIDMLVQRDAELEHHLFLHAKGDASHDIASIASSQVAGTEVSLTTTFTLDAKPYPRRLKIDGHALVFGAATTVGVVGDVWELRIKRDGTVLQHSRWHNQIGATWNQSIGVTYTTGVDADAAQSWELTLIRVAGSGGCRTYADGTTNQFSVTAWPRPG